ncbi:hypothetical protein SHKM778_35520 [Streptomyces sp. KM77-8]|uniref:Uncharacterized protein n=1 Tax=Streptomyces haneummycinicus TaxID=3074435 RepID=A0AAT9HJ24_9ACTN
MQPSVPFSMVHMVKGALDLGLAILLAGLEAAALVAFCLVEGMKKWVAKEGRFLVRRAGSSWC